MKSSEATTAWREALTAVTSLAFMTPSMAINALHQLNTPGPLVPAYASASASVMSVLLAAGAPFVIKRKTDASIRLAAVAAFIVCAGYNLQTAIGAASLSRSSGVGTREAEAARAKLLAGQVAQAETSRAALARAVGEDTTAMIEATLKAMRQDAKWSRSKNASGEGCEDATKEDTRAFCAEYAKKLATKNAAMKIGELDVQLDDLKRKLITATNAATSQAADPQASNVVLVLEMIGVSAEAAKVGVGLNLWFALTIEVLAALGPVVLSVLFSGSVSKPSTPTEGKAETPAPAPEGKEEKPDTTKGCKPSGLSMVGGTDVTVTAMVAASSAQEAAARLGVSERTIWRRIAEEKSKAGGKPKSRASAS